jgi:hypothetical protein
MRGSSVLPYGRGLCIIIAVIILLFLPLTFSGNNNASAQSYSNPNPTIAQDYEEYILLLDLYRTEIYRYESCLDIIRFFAEYVGTFGAVLPYATTECKLLNPPPRPSQPAQLPRPEVEPCGPSGLGPSSVSVKGGYVITKPCRPAVAGACPPNHTMTKDGTLCWFEPPKPPKCGPNELITQSSTGEFGCQKDFDADLFCKLKAGVIPKKVGGKISGQIPIPGGGPKIGESPKIGGEIGGEWELDEYKKAVYEQCMHENRIYH